MGRTDVCWDNSMTESFLSMLKNERVYRTVYATEAQARSDVILYIEGFYNSQPWKHGLIPLSEILTAAQFYAANKVFETPEPRIQRESS